jgi:ElaB/YqjD/DUF883 family membrane-anchored ribosome-binding protein
MSGGTDRILDDLQRVLGDLEQVVKGAMNNASGQAEEVADKIRNALDKAQGRIDEAEQVLGRNLRHGAKVADVYVKDNVWMSLGVMAAVAFVVGFAMGRRQ